MIKMISFLKFCFFGDKCKIVKIEATCLIFCLPADSGSRSVQELRINSTTHLICGV